MRPEPPDYRRETIFRGGLSAVRTVGRLERPPASSWNELIVSARGRAELILSFQSQAAAGLGLGLSAVRVGHQVWLAGPGRQAEAAGPWHLDACKGAGHVLCVVGEPPSEFLLGVVPPGTASEAAEAAAPSLKLWQPEAGEMVYVDRATVHRRPAIGAEHVRMFLLGTAY